MLVKGGLMIRIIYVIVVFFTLQLSAYAATSQMVIDSLPETATIYRDGYGYLQETLYLQSSKPGGIRLPVGTDIGSIVLMQGTSPLQNLLIVEEKNLGYRITIPKEIASQTNPAALVLRYLVNGLSWKPQIDVNVSRNGELTVSLKALVRNTSVNLESSRILLASGAGPMAKQLYFDVAVSPYRQKKETPVYGGADMFYDLGRRSIEKNSDAVVIFPIISSAAKYQIKYLWETQSRNRIQRLMLIENPFTVSLCPADVNLLFDSILFKAGEAEWTDPGNVFTIKAGVETGLFGEKSIVTSENPSKKPLSFNHAIEYTVTNKTKSKVTVEVMSEKKIGYQHRSEYHFIKEPDKTPGHWNVWVLDIPAGTSNNIKFDVDSDRKDYEEYRTYDRAALGA
jgi:hypothetical protein